MKTRPDVVAMFTLLTESGWELLLRRPECWVWQYCTGHVVTVPNNPRDRAWRVRLWEQAANIMEAEHPVPANAAQKRRVTIAELALKGFWAEAAELAREPLEPYGMLEAA